MKTLRGRQRLSGLRGIKNTHGWALIAAFLVMAVMQLVAAPGAQAQSGECAPPIVGGTDFTQSTDGCYAASLEWRVTPTSVEGIYANRGTEDIVIHVVGQFSGLTADCTFRFDPSGISGPFGDGALNGEFERVDTFALLSPGETFTATCVGTACGAVSANGWGDVYLAPDFEAGNLVSPPGVRTIFVGADGTLDPCDNSLENQANGSLATGALVSLSTTASSESAPVGETVDWTMTALNSGSRDLRTVVISNALPAGLEVVTPLPDGISYDPTTRTVSGIYDGTLPPGASHSITFATVVKARSQVTNVANVSSAQGAADQASAAVFGLADGSETVAGAADTPATPLAQVEAPALAFTGVSSAELAGLGAAMLVAGCGLVTWSRSKETRTP